MKENFQFLIAGASAGTMEHLSTFPIDTVKTVVQSLDRNSLANRSSLQTFRTLMRAGGFKRLFRGATLVLFFEGPAHALHFGTYEIAKKALLGDDQLAGETPFRVGAAGAVASVVSEAFINPFDVLKQRLQLSRQGAQGVWEYGYSIFKNEGLRAFFVSYPTSIAIQIPYVGIQFAVYECCRLLFLGPNSTTELETSHLGAHLLSGAIAGGFAAALTNPLDVVKTVLQTASVCGKTSPNARLVCSRCASARQVRLPPGLFTAALSTARAIAQTHGFRGFWAGVGARMLANAPAASVSWATYEYVKTFLQLSAPPSPSPPGPDATRL